MNSQYIVNSLDKIFIWITRLVAINVLWVFYTMIGLIAGGIFPATLTVLKIFRMWIMGDPHVPIWSTFQQEYWKVFWTSNMMGWMMTIAGGVLYFNYTVMKSMGSLNIVTYAAFYLLILFYLNVLIWSFPQLAHYNGSIKLVFKNAIIFGFGKFHYTVAIMVYMFAVLYVSLNYPGILPFFTISVLAFGWIWISMNLFQKVDLKIMSAER
ncbi:DUF624 domain-containing protein [Bacillus lacus]|uniref:DUF624 domain-containing protein n=1 Tax=Metabacillus lacus TaxID=1983721 RepID=A0A7X2LZ33_9BACI|nr:YesL family protein [Metabacillus lacus]MRX71527.1 DUF624 domain-containing protein [Metabacillus lacus]